MVVIKTEMSKLQKGCEDCSYFCLKMHPIDGIEDMVCRLSGVMLISRDERRNYDGEKRPDNCPLMELVEVENDK